MDKVPVIEDKAFTLYLEEYEEYLIIHCDVYKWLKSTRKKMEVCLEYLLKQNNRPIYAEHLVNDAKHTKFLNIYGFKYYGVIQDDFGKQREIFVRGSK